MSRDEALIGQPQTVGFRHFYNGVVADVDQMLGVQVLNPSFQVVHSILPSSISHVALGGYQVTIPGSVLSQLGHYYDVWHFNPIPGSDRRLQFDIHVVNQTTPPAVDFNEITNGCTLESIDACHLKRFYLWPVWSALQFYAPYDSILQFHLDKAISWAQTELGIPLRQHTVMTPPFGTYYGTTPTLGVDYDEEGSLIQFSHAENQEWGNIRLPHSGLIRVTGLRGIYAGQVVYTIPPNWIENNEFKNGVIRIRPSTTGLVNQMVDSSGVFLENTLVEARGTLTVPGFWACDYVYGQKNNKFAGQICDLIFKKAAVTLLDQLGMKISQGLANKSASVDGLSSSISLVTSTERTMFSALAARYEQDLSPENLFKLRQRFKGPVVFIC